MFCRNCGVEINDLDTFCYNCGSRQTDEPKNVQPVFIAQKPKSVLKKPWFWILIIVAIFSLFSTFSTIFNLMSNPELFNEYNSNNPFDYEDFFNEYNEDNNYNFDFE